MKKFLFVFIGVFVAVLIAGILLRVLGNNSVKVVGICLCIFSSVAILLCSANIATLSIKDKIKKDNFEQSKNDWENLK